MCASITKHAHILKTGLHLLLETVKKVSSALLFDGEYSKNKKWVVRTFVTRLWQLQHRRKLGVGRPSHNALPLLLYIGVLTSGLCQVADNV